jgi:hypothetical protein
LKQAPTCFKQPTGKAFGDLLEIYSLEAKTVMTYLLSLNEDKSAINIEYSSRPQENPEKSPADNAEIPQQPAKGGGKGLRGGEDIWNPQRFILSQSILSDMKALTLAELKTGIQATSTCRCSCPRPWTTTCTFISIRQVYIKWLPIWRCSNGAFHRILLVGTGLYIMVGAHKPSKTCSSGRPAGDLDFSQRCEVRGRR